MKILLIVQILIWGLSAHAATRAQYSIAIELIKEKDCNQAFLNKSSKLLADESNANHPKLSELLVNGCQFAAYPAAICESRADIIREENKRGNDIHFENNLFPRLILGQEMTDEKITSLIDDKDDDSTNCEDKIALLMVYKDCDMIQASFPKIFPRGTGSFENNKAQCEQAIKSINNERVPIINEKVAMCAKARGTSTDSVKTALCSKYPWVCKGMTETASTPASSKKSNSYQAPKKSYNSSTNSGGVAVE